MSILHAIELGGEEVHKDRSVATGAFSLNGHDSSFIMSTKKAVLKVPTLGRKSTNMQPTYFCNTGSQQYNSSFLVWRLHDMPLQAVTCHFFAEAWIIISQVISQLYLQHVSCLDMFWCVCHVHLYFTSSTFWYWCQKMHTQNTYCTWAVSPTPGIQSLYTGKQMLLTATLFTAHCRNTN